MKLSATDRSQIITNQNLHCIVPIVKAKTTAKTAKQQNNCKNTTTNVERNPPWELGERRYMAEHKLYTRSPSVRHASVDLSNAIHCLSIGKSRITAGV